jgi:hypothetical protein
MPWERERRFDLALAIDSTPNQQARKYVYSFFWSDFTAWWGSVIVADIWDVADAGTRNELKRAGGGSGDMAPTPLVVLLKCGQEKLSSGIA